MTGPRRPESTAPTGGRSPRAARRARITGAAVALVLIVVAVIAGIAYRQDARDDARDANRRRADTIAAALTRALTNRETVVRATGSFLEEQTYATREEFRRFTGELQGDVRADTSVTWNPRVGAAFPTLYIHPPGPTPLRPGGDLGADPRRRAAVLLAWTRGVPTLTGPLTLAPGVPGALLVAPARGPLGPGRRVRGVVTSSVSYPALEESLTSALPHIGFAVDDGEDRILGTGTPAASSGRTTVMAAGRRWSVQAWGVTAGGLVGGMMIGALGSAVAVLIGLLIAQSGRREQRVADEVVRRTRQLAEARDRAASVVGQAQDGIATIAADGTLEEANARYRELIALDATGPVTGVDALSVWHPDDRAAVAGALEDARAGRVPVPLEVRPRAGDGPERWTRLAHGPLLPERPAEGVVQVATDITERRRSEATEAALRRIAVGVAAGDDPETVLSAVAAESRRLVGGEGAWVLRFEPAGRALVIGADLSGPAFAEALGMDTSVGRLLGTPEGTSLAEVRRTGRPARRDRYVHDPADPDVPTAISSSVAVPVIADGTLWGGLTVASAREFGLPADAEARLERFASVAGLAVAAAGARAELVEQATTDFVTRLANHRVFYDRLTREVGRARAAHELSLAVFDVDGFGMLGVTHGHAAGDAALAVLAGLMAGRVRQRDLLARIGGDELALLMPDTPLVEAVRIADEMRERIAGHVFGEAGRLTVSVGVAGTREAGADKRALLRAADAALYWAKAEGRDRVRAHDAATMTDLTPGDRVRRLERDLAMRGLRALARAVDARDTDTREHSERVASLAEDIARALRWDPEDARRLRDAALVHDIGKLGVPDAVLHKPGALDPAEIEVVRTHAPLGAEIVGDVLDTEQVAWVRHHHERFDGRGYPTGLRGDEIPAGARILAVADSYDVMVSVRTYKAARETGDALDEVRCCAGTQFDPAAVSALLRLAAVGRIPRPSHNGH